MLDNDSQSLDNIPLRIKQRIHSIDLFDSDYVMTWNVKIPYVANTLKNIYISTNILNEFTSTYYDDKNGYFAKTIQQYTSSSVNKMYHPSLIEEFKTNLYKSDYKYNLH